MSERRNSEQMEKIDRESTRVREMTFDELLDEACKSAKLPNTAREQLPNALSDQTKQMVLKLLPEELGQILSDAIETVNKGSVEPIDKLVKEQVER